ncbi:MAG TPA: hypothetical protein VJM32_03850 [Candidatus Saccharimonadales bacterium]|nr:hypothetical protein [Candidatus Saccharimonadales bacterium]
MRKTHGVSTYTPEQSGARYFGGLGAMTLLALVATAVMPLAPMAGIALMIVVVGLGVALLQGDAPLDTDGRPIPSGAACMEALYEEIERERLGGRVYPFGNWLPRHAVLYHAGQVFHPVDPLVTTPWRDLR